MFFTSKLPILKVKQNAPSPRRERRNILEFEAASSVYRLPGPPGTIIEFSFLRCKRRVTAFISRIIGRIEKYHTNSVYMPRLELEDIVIVYLITFPKILI